MLALGTVSPFLTAAKRPESTGNCGMSSVLKEIKISTQQNSRNSLEKNNNKII
jgi:hypothetical protein